jgi:hypothetical protein
MPLRIFLHVCRLAFLIICLAAQVISSAAQSSTLFAVPLPQPAKPLAPLALPPAVGFRSQGPSDAEIGRVIPDIEIWRPGSNIPQLPDSHFQKTRRLVSVLLTGNQPVMVRLRFHPLSRGKVVLVRAARGVTLNPAGEAFSIPADGQCVIALSLDSGMTESHVSFACEGLTSTLVLTRTSPNNVAARESATPGAGQ